MTQPNLSGKNRLGWLALTLAGAAGCGNGNDGVSFERQVRPLLESRCVTCHHSDNKGGLVDLEDPFTLDESPSPPGLVGSKNVWAEGHPGFSPEYNVVPFEPDNSFLMWKIDGHELSPGDNGYSMPLAPPRLPEESIQAVRRWIAEGAEDTPFYRDNVFGIFGDLDNRHGLECQRAGLPATCVVCVTCHYPGSPDPPDFSNPFDPVEGVVGVAAAFRSDLLLVEPGNPDASFLVMKLEAAQATSEFGAPMPYSYTPFLDEQVDVIRQWIVEGARNN